MEIYEARSLYVYIMENFHNKRNQIGGEWARERWNKGKAVVREEVVVECDGRSFGLITD